MPVAQAVQILRIGGPVGGDDGEVVGFGLPAGRSVAEPVGGVGAVPADGVEDDVGAGLGELGGQDVDVVADGVESEAEQSGV